MCAHPLRRIRTWTAVLVVSMLACAAGLSASSLIHEAAIDGMAGIEIDSPTGPVKVHADSHHVTLNMFLAKTEGAGLETVQALGPLAPEAGCA